MNTMNLFFLFSQPEIPGVTPPPATDFKSFLIWVISTLVVVVIAVFTLYRQSQKAINAIYEQRIADKDEAMKEHALALKTAQDQLHKFAVEIKPALEASSKILEQILKYLQDEKRNSKS